MCQRFKTCEDWGKRSILQDSRETLFVPAFTSLAAPSIDYGHSAHQEQTPRQALSSRPQVPGLARLDTTWYVHSVWRSRVRVDRFFPVPTIRLQGGSAAVGALTLSLGLDKQGPSLIDVPGRSHFSKTPRPLTFETQTRYGLMEAYCGH